jgi:hypothetical protein
MTIPPTNWRDTLHNLRQQQPTAHPYTLALLLEVQTGIRISGATAAKALRSNPGPAVDRITSQP